MNESTAAALLSMLSAGARRESASTAAKQSTADAAAQKQLPTAEELSEILERSSRRYDKRLELY